MTKPSICVAFALSLAVPAIAQDSRAFAESMFLPSGPAGPATNIQTWCSTPPSIGNTVEVVVDAPGRSAGGVLLATAATSGIAIPLPCGYSLIAYVNPASLLGSIPIVLGQGRGAAWLTVPWSTGLIGFDLAFQSWAMNGACDVGLSNLVAGNIGSAPNQGNAMLAHEYGPITLPAGTTWSVAGTRMPVVTNSTSGNTQPYRLIGTKTPGVGPLQLVDESGAVVGSAAAGDTAFTIAVSVAPNRRLFLRNAGSAAMSVRWTLSAVWS